MSEIHYEAHPLVFRMHPLSTLFYMAIMLLGLIVVGIGRYVPATMLDGLVAGLSADQFQWVGIGVFALAGLRLYIRYAPTRFQRLTVTDDTLTWSQGFTNKQVMQIPLSRIRELKIDQTGWQRWLYIGDLSVYTDGDQPTLAVKGLPLPEDIIPVYERRAKQ